MEFSDNVGISESEATIRLLPDADSWCDVVGQRWPSWEVEWNEVERFIIENGTHLAF